jgi:hypothetical protein
MGLVLMSQSDLLMSGGQMSGETRKGMARSEYADMPPGSGRRGRKTMEITYREVAWVLTNYRRLNGDQRALLAARHGIGMEPKTLNEIAHETGRSRRQVLDDELLALRTLAAEIEANRTTVESEPAGAVLREVGATLSHGEAPGLGVPDQRPTDEHIVQVGPVASGKNDGPWYKATCSCLGLDVPRRKKRSEAQQDGIDHRREALKLATDGESYRRADGNVICGGPPEECPGLYRDHPVEEFPGSTSDPDNPLVLHRLCSGELVKL